jgi:hypothetical protein
MARIEIENLQTTVNKIMISINFHKTYITKERLECVLGCGLTELNDVLTL